MLDLQLLFPLTFLGMKHILQERYDVTRQRRRRHLAYQCCICRVRLRKSTTSEEPRSLRTIFAATASTLRLPFSLLYQRKKERERGKMGPSLIIGSPFFLYKKHTEPPTKRKRGPKYYAQCCQNVLEIKISNKCI